MISTLKRFGDASDLCINIPKSRLIFPKTLHHRLRCSYLIGVHIPASIAFGKYLGIPVVTHKPKMANYEKLLNKFTKWMAGWKTHFTNFVGRVALIKSVLTSLSVYHMQTTLLPSKILSGMEKIMRRFLRGHSRYLIQINWKTICLPSRCGGIDIRNLVNGIRHFSLSFYGCAIKNVRFLGWVNLG